MHLAAVTLAYPIALHGLDLLGPPRQIVQLAQQFLGIGSDAHEIHGDVALLHQRTGTPAAPINHLLVGQHRIVHRVPIHWGGFFVNQTFVE